jgi:hypothetical protein
MSSAPASEQHSHARTSEKLVQTVKKLRLPRMCNQRAAEFHVGFVLSTCRPVAAPKVGNAAETGAGRCARIRSIRTLRFLQALMQRESAAARRGGAKVSPSGASDSASDWRLRERRVGDRRSSNRSSEPCVEGQVRNKG